MTSSGWKRSVHGGRRLACLSRCKRAACTTWSAVACWLVATAGAPCCLAGELTGTGYFRERVQPILETHCYGCHGYGAAEGGRTLDEFASDEALLGDTDLWLAVLRNVRANVMPPAEEDRPDDEERAILFNWIKRDVFKIDPANPDPGRVTLRRLNRVEYRHTIRDLTGVDFNTSEHFLQDDSGYGFDNIGDVLTLSPLLLEKYLEAAEKIVEQAVPAGSRGEEDWTEPEGYRRFFPKGPPPSEADGRDAYAREVLTEFVNRAYRRPVDEGTVDRLVALANAAYGESGHSFEEGVARAMVAVLASPRFLFRVEAPDPTADNAEPFPLVDEHALASRLSYFLWSTMPDARLRELADRGELRANLSAEVERMLQDRRSRRLVENFVGQWLRSRDVPHVHVDVNSVVGLREIQGRLRRLREEHRRHRRPTQQQIDRLERELRKLPADDVTISADADEKDKSEIDTAQQAELEQKRGQLQQQLDALRDEMKAIEAKHEEERGRLEAERARRTKLRDAFSTGLRRAMRQETEAGFEHLMREDGSLLELLDADYTFVNEELASYYGIPGVKGNEVRRVELPADSPRGGILTQGTLLVVTSNPTRTSPVKRGMHILENILGTPAPPPPPDIPTLEQAAPEASSRNPTGRELLEIHRRDPLCYSCHARMDPLGLALENFDALGMWRDFEKDQPIDPSGQLLTGEKFGGIQELKRILKEQHQLDFYRCLTEKMLTYALGRGLDYYDEHTVDTIVGQLEAAGGRSSALVMGIIESAPFQRQRRSESD